MVWQKGTKSPQAAGKIHTDFEKGFIMAEVMKFEDFKEGGSEVAVKVSFAFLSKSLLFQDFTHWKCIWQSVLIIEIKSIVALSLGKEYRYTGKCCFKV